MEIGIQMYRGLNEVRQGVQLDVGFIAWRLFNTFPGIALEEEYFQRHIARVRQVAEQLGKDAGLVRIATGDAEERGPAYAFHVVSASGSPLHGSFNRYGLAFVFDEAVDPELKRKAEQFLDSFGIKRFQYDGVTPRKSPEKT
jgi:hypothetical protein